MTDDIAARLRAFISETYLYARPDVKLTGSTSLLAAGIIDSLGVMELVGFVEQTWGLVVSPEDITEANFGSVDAIASYISARRAGAS